MDSQPLDMGSSWSWPDDIPTAPPENHMHDHHADHTEGTHAHHSEADTGFGPGPSFSEEDAAPEPQPTDGQKHYKSRTCRICLEVVQPSFEVPAEGPASFLRPKPRVTYNSEDPESGRLISPCKCKGTQRYVHEGCLQAWRQASPLSDRNFWKCPTCGFEYRMDRLKWAGWISNRLTRAFATFVVFTLAVWILGFVADPILNLWLDPLGTVTGTVIDIVGDEELQEIFALQEELPGGWWEHFMKGFFSLGILGFVKTIIAAGPWYWFNFRTGGGLGGRQRGGGQDRIDNINWLLIVIGVFTFLGLVWKAVGAVSGRFLEQASERVMDVQGDDDDDDDGGNETSAEGDTEHATQNTTAQESRKDR